MKKAIITILLLSIFEIGLYGQTNSFVPQIKNIPSSPEAALLERFGEIPVSYYKGVPNISIPLYNIKVDDVEIPLTLSYQSSGIKVEDESTWVGLGWSLEPGGAIVQETRGMPDQYDNLYTGYGYGINSTTFLSFAGRFPGSSSFYYKLNQWGDCTKQPILFSASYLPVCTTVPSESDNEYIVISLGAGNGQPDIYHYDFCGHSGSYFKNPINGLYTSLDQKEGLKISNNTIWTPEGNKYSFSAEEITQNTSGTGLVGITRKLGNITLQNGKEISFEYDPENFYTYHKGASLVLNPYEDNANAYNPMTSYSFGKKQALSRIVSPQITIVFNKENRADFLTDTLNKPIKRLRSIDVFSTQTGAKLKTFEFQYSYFNDAGDYRSKRLRLDGVKEIGYDENGAADLSKPGYEISYTNSVALPSKDSFAKDFFGYYNGENANSNLLPDLRFFDFPFDSEYMVNGLTIFKNDTFYATNRYPDNSKACAGLITSIKYPTGGHTDFEFEPNTFQNQFIPTKQQVVQMQTTKSCYMNNLASTGPTSGISFTIGDASVLHFRNTFQHGSPISGNVLDENTVHTIWFNSKVTLKKNGTLIKTWNLNNLVSEEDFKTSGSFVVVEDYFVGNDPTANYTITCNFPVFSYTPPNGTTYYGRTNTQCQFYDKSLVDSSFSSCGGFRIKTIKNYTDDTTLAASEIYDYNHGKLLNKFRPLGISETMYTTLAETPTETGVTYTGHASFFKRVTLSTDFFGNARIGYGEVEVKKSSSNQLNGKTRHHFYNDELTTSPGSPDIENYRNGLKFKEEIFDVNENKVEQTEFNYITISGGVPYYGIIATNHCKGDTEWWSVLVQPLRPESIPSFHYKYTYDVYPVSPACFKLSQVSKTNYFSSGNITTSDSYTYTSDGIENSKTFQNSVGDILVESKEFAPDYPFDDQIEQTMINNHMIGIPIKTDVLRNDFTLSTTKNEYAKDATTENNILPKFVFTEKGGSNLSLDKRVTCDLYDALGNLLQYHLESGTLVSIVWGYNNTLPVAKIQGVAYGDLDSVVGSIQSESSSATGSESTLLSYLGELRQAHPDAMMTTYTYKPGVGVSTITDAKGETTSFKYDNFGRLAEARDNTGNLLSTNDYNYRP